MIAKYLTIMCLIVINCRIAKTYDHPKKKPELESGECSFSTQDWSHLNKPTEIERLWKNLEIKEWIQSDEVHLGYTTADHLIKMLPYYTEKIKIWIKTNPGEDKDKPFELIKPRFDVLLRSLRVKSKELHEINEWVEENEKNKLIELEKLWDKLELIKVDENEEKRLGYTTKANLIKVLPNHVQKILEWTDDNPKKKEDEPFQLSKIRFLRLLQSLKLNLDELQELNKYLEENPQIFKGLDDLAS